MNKLLTAYQLAKFVTDNGFRKYKQVQFPQTKEYRYAIKGLTESEWEIFENENLSDAEVEQRVEAGGWVLLDAFTASALTQVYEALTKESNANAEANKARFNQLPLKVLVGFAWKQVR